MEQRTYQGALYERSGPGQPWTRVGAAPGPAPTLTPLTPPAGPREPPPQTPTQVAIEEQRLATMRAEEQRRAQAHARSMAQGTRTTAGAGGITAEAAATARGRIAAARQLRAQLEEFERLFVPYEGVTTPAEVGAMVGINATEGVQQAQAAAAGMMPLARQAFRVPGSGSDTEREAQYIEGIIPSLSTADATTRQRIAQLYRMIDDTEREQSALLGEAPPEAQRQQQVAAPPVPGRPQPPAPPPAGPGMDRGAPLIVTPSGGQDRELGDGETTLVEDPVLRGIAGRLGRMVSGSASDQQILDYLQRAGVSPTDTNVMAILAYRRSPEFRAWRRANPGRAYPIGESFYTRDVPQSTARQILSGAANSAPGAFVTSAADAITMGTLDNLMDNPAQARAGMSALRAENPGSALAGTIVGGALTAGGMEAAAPALGLRGIAGARAADAAFGAAYGAGSADEGSRVSGAVMGAGAGALGGVTGRAITRGAGRTLTGARSATTRYLADRGVPLTIGQIAGQGGTMGRAVRSIESRLESIPILGEAIRNRRAEGYEAFNRQAFDQALEPIGGRATGIGEEGVEAARGQVSQAYDDALSGVQVQADSQFVSEMRAAIGRGQGLPGGMADEFAYTIQERVAPELANGSLTGESYQAIRQGLRQDRQAMRGQPRAHDFAEAVRGVEEALEQLVRRGAPDVVPALNRANRAHGLTRTVEGAVERGTNSGGVFTPAQLGASARQSGRRFGNTAATTERPFFELQRAGQDALPSTVPNSGTADRSLAIAATAGAAGGLAYTADAVSPQTAAIMTVLGLPFTRAGQAAFQKMLVSRPDVVRQAGERVIANQRYLGAAGAGTAPNLLLTGPGQ